MRIIFLFIVVITIFWLVKRLFFKPSDHSTLTSQSEQLVQCHYCQTHIPLSEAVKSEGKIFCCNDHAKHG